MMTSSQLARSSGTLSHALTCLACAFCVAALAVLASAPVSAQGGRGGDDAKKSTAKDPVVKDRLSTTRELLKQLGKVRDQISREKRDWLDRKQKLTVRMELLRNQIADYRKQIESLDSKTASADKANKELKKKLERLDAGVAVLKDAVPELEKRVRALAARLPSPILSRVQALVDALPKDPKETKLNLSQRYSFVTTILDQVAKFHQEITVEPEARDVGGTKVTVTTVYFGCGQAFYASAKSDVAGIGTADGKKWVWVPVDDKDATKKKSKVDAIRRLIAIVQGEKGAAFVPVPVVIK